jgi:hypothetical protein
MGSSSSSMFMLLLRLLVLLWLVQPAVAFMPVMACDIYLETLAVGLPLAVLQQMNSSLGDTVGRPPILVRVIRRGTITPTVSRHVVTTTRDGQTELVIALWAGAGSSPYRYPRAGDVLLGFVRQTVPAAPRGTVQVQVTISVLFEQCGEMRGGMGPPAYRDRLLVATEVIEQDGKHHHHDDNNSTNTPDRRSLPPPQIRDLVLWQHINVDPPVVPANDRYVACWPRGRGWDPVDLEVHKSLVAADSNGTEDNDDDDDDDIDACYPRYREMSQWRNESNKEEQDDDDDDDEHEHDDKVGNAQNNGSQEDFVLFIGAPSGGAADTF